MSRYIQYRDAVYRLDKNNCRNSTLQGADLRWANLLGARYNAQTKFPQGFDPEAAGMLLVY